MPILCPSYNDLQLTWHFIELNLIIIEVNLKHDILGVNYDLLFSQIIGYLLFFKPFCFGAAWV